MSALPNGSSAVMAQRHEPPDSLDDFPTPPWATRALIEIVLGYTSLKNFTAWEPAAGRGIMAEVLAEYFQGVHGSDVHDYGKGYSVGTFVGQGPDRAEWDPWGLDWVITNPPFNLAVEFAERALQEAEVGVALLLRANWTEGVERYERIFRRRPPTTIAYFVERVPMVRGRWDPDASTATAYAWFVWDVCREGGDTRAIWIPPGQRQALTRPDDRRRFAPAPEPTQLFGNGDAIQ